MEGCDARDVIMALPPTLAREVFDFYFIKHFDLERMPFWDSLYFHKLSIEDQRIFASSLQPMVVYKEEVIFWQDDDDQTFYIATDGVSELFDAMVTAIITCHATGNRESELAVAGCGVSCAECVERVTAVTNDTCCAVLCCAPHVPAQ